MKDQTPATILTSANGDVLLTAKKAADSLGCTDMHLRAICRNGAMTMAIFTRKPLLFKESMLSAAWSARPPRGRPKGAKNKHIKETNLDKIDAKRRK